MYVLIIAYTPINIMTSTSCKTPSHWNVRRGWDHTTRKIWFYILSIVNVMIVFKLYTMYIYVHNIMLNIMLITKRRKEIIWWHVMGLNCLEYLRRLWTERVTLRQNWTLHRVFVATMFYISTFENVKAIVSYSDCTINVKVNIDPDITYIFN